MTSDPDLPRTDEPADLRPTAEPRHYTELPGFKPLPTDWADVISNVVVFLVVAGVALGGLYGLVRFVKWAWH